MLKSSGRKAKDLRALSFFKKSNSCKIVRDMQEYDDESRGFKVLLEHGIMTFHNFVEIY